MKKNDSSHPTLAEIRNAHGWKRDYEKFLPVSRFLFRPLGFILAWAAIRIGLTTESVAWLSGIVGIAACVLLITGNGVTIGTGIGLLLFFNLLDCVDGSIARATNTENPYGQFLDSVCGGIVDLAFWGIIGVLAFRNEGLLLWPNLFDKGTSFWTVIGGLTCFFRVIVSFIEKIFNSTLRGYWDEIQKNNNYNSRHQLRNRNNNMYEDPNSNFRYIVRMINTNLRVRENHYSLLIIVYLLHTIDLLLAAYFSYYLSQIIILILAYSRRGRMIRHMYIKDI